MPLSVFQEEMFDVFFKTIISNERERILMAKNLIPRWLKIGFQI